ncbi:MAG: bifunctional phosphoribosylaminoimidazolecarboxamide formyltransferase/IMP cyclohydrolase PurH [Candidatus Jettenia sp.]|uniref:Bifunctional purine biosynthesis protein PurH n=1 Tax=Candidatus Jettenia caeni TaxID=247490 RepID=I3IQE2_9BACT|nr:bifunctional phosphoribosylaminoimidazolecarboxamide formyltransferase/IMP cyclohydrolase [Candidatus Jettenia sp. AMX1]MBC6927960.1 bifunctional phosphoribosylaminoimidazolecarboxamide formyltransferase/IMP cyclohydrolase PurH [Candidatus Jettenia sp.]NUN22995.1 bifunctional phosphoribosylaminoimidazolecarboxamide formyltransferase/IMP cyclohydrolase [Candidatus Jettenia caeni]KAA0248909.1 MAG: bifunctional phosphoribosylaminoimidazolecarboxamide formyltransferase/IMP cyclohydrolase PurH [Ca
MTRVERALISVSDKTGIVEFAKELQHLGIEIVSTGGTSKLLKENGIRVIEISEYTGFPEIMDGRVKTLHPRVHGGLLALRDNEIHKRQMRELEIKPIDMVVVNLYPFEKTIAKKDVSMEEAIENIDIGGPSMIRSASKNYKQVIVVVNPKRYNFLIEELKANHNDISEKMRLELAIEAFRTTGRYDRIIANYFDSLGEEKGGYPTALSLDYIKRQALRYGENPHQTASFYIEENVQEPCISNAQQLYGKELSYNNIIDLNAALELVKEFERPSAIVIKHTNPCGSASADTLAEAFINAYRGDPVSAFGCILGLNKIVDSKTAEAITEPGHFVEAIIAPDYEQEAIEILTTKRKWGSNLRILKTGELLAKSIDPHACDMKRVIGGMLLQSRDLTIYDSTALKIVTRKKPSEKEMADLRFAFIVCKHVKSNSIVLAKNEAVIGVGAGQMSRIDSTEIAMKKAGERVKGAVMASDAFFPFRDNVDAAAKAGIIAIIQPGGSTKDDESIAAADEHGIAMVFTGQRHFRH